ncbi:unnamed protein product [Aphanomyces euteiches]
MTVPVNVYPVPELPQIDISGRYVMIPCALSRWSYIGLFLNERVIQEKRKGYIVGPPGTGKSMATLSFEASLNRTKWRVIWIHLKKYGSACFLDMGTNQFWRCGSATFALPRSHFSNAPPLVVCLDGFSESAYHLEVLRNIEGQLYHNDRFVVCSTMSTPGTRNTTDDFYDGIEFFFMYSWTRDEYRAAVEIPELLNLVKDNLDATPLLDVNDPSELTGDDNLDAIVDIKFYYAGGSCRFMFESSTKTIQAELQNKLEVLYGMNEKYNRVPLSQYAISLFAKASYADTITSLEWRYRASGEVTHPSLESVLLEWLFLVTVPRRRVGLVDSKNDIKVELPQTKVLYFDPRKNFKTTENGAQRQICGNKVWLKPIVPNEKGYDALYFDVEAGQVVFVRLMRSSTIDLTLAVFANVLSKLHYAGMKKEMNVEIYVVIKPSKMKQFKIRHIEDHGELTEYDKRWTTLNKSVPVLVFEYL